jgi:hypothetical protein
MKRLRDSNSDINNYKKAHLGNDPYFDSWHDSFTKYNRHFSPYHKTDPRLASIFELCEEIDKLKPFTSISSEREKIIELVKLRKKEINKIYETIKMESANSELGAELIFILELFL